MWHAGPSGAPYGFDISGVELGGHDRSNWYGTKKIQDD